MTCFNFDLKIDDDKKYGIVKMKFKLRFVKKRNERAMFNKHK